MKQFGKPGGVSREAAASVSRRKKILITMAGGGFGHETLSLVDMLGDAYEFDYVLIKGLSEDVEPKIKRRGAFWPMTSPGVTGDGRLRQLTLTLRAFVDAWHILRASRPDVVIGVGTSLALPVCFWAKLLGTKTIFIESISRPNRMAMTGRVIRLFGLYDRFYVQWPLLQSPPHVRYMGRLL